MLNRKHTVRSNLIPLINSVNKYRQDHLLEAGNKIIEALGEHNKYAGDSQLKVGDATVQKCFAQLVKSYDPNMGGFSKAPKFPQVTDCCKFVLFVH